MIILTRPQSFSISKVSRKKGAVKKMQTKAFVLIGTRIQEQYSCFPSQEGNPVVSETSETFQIQSVAQQ